MAEKIRCFIALDLPDELKDELILIRNQIEKENLFTGKFTEKEHLHLTLKFFGSINQTIVGRIKSKLRTISLPSFSVSLGSTGVFSEEFVRVVWTELMGAGVHTLQKEVDKRVVDLAAPEEEFMSHITIARVKSLKEKEKLFKAIKKLSYNKTETKIKSFSLMKSTLTPKGPVYEVIEKYKLT